MMSTSTCDAARGAHDQGIPDPDKAKQRRALLTALREHGAISTSDIREYLYVMHPAGRVRELRLMGHDIATVMSWSPDSDGHLHWQATYSLGEGVHHGA